MHIFLFWVRIATSRTDVMLQWKFLQCHSRLQGVRYLYLVGSSCFLDLQIIVIRCITKALCMEKEPFTFDNLDL